MVSVCTRMSQTIYLLRKSSRRSCLTLTNLSHTLFHANIRVLLSAAEESWAHDWQSMVHKIPLLPCFHQATVFNRYVLQSLIFVKTNLNFFGTRNEVHGCALYRRALNQVRCRLRKTQDCFQSQTVKVFKNLSSHIKELKLGVFI